MALKTVIRKHWVNGIYALALCAVASTTSFNFFHGRTVLPYTELHAEVLTPEVRVGEPLIIEISGTRKRLCAVSLSRGVVNIHTGRMVHQDFVPVGFALLGPFKRSFEMRLPEHVGPGEYILKGIQNNDCGEEVFPLPYPDIAFRIISQN